MEMQVSALVMMGLGAIGLGGIAYFVRRAGRKQAMPTVPPSAEVLRKAKLRFIAAMNRRIFHEPKIAPQLQPIRDMVVGWYELKGPVVGVRFVAKACCERCKQLDGQQFSLLDVRTLVRHIPPIHQEGGRLKDCTCTLLPVSVSKVKTRSGRTGAGSPRNMAARP